MSEGARELMWIRSLLLELEVCVGTSVVYEDNQACIKLASSVGNYNRTKHIDLKYHHVNDLISKKLIKLDYVETNKNLSDMLTKALCERKIEYTMSELGFVIKM